MSVGSPEILIGHPLWGRGGAELVGMWIIQALCKRYEVSLVTRAGFDLKELNHLAGTAVEPHEVKCLEVPALANLSIKGGLIWHALFLRHCRDIAPEYDLCITVSRLIDWGVPAVHFLSDVVWSQRLQEQFDVSAHDRKQRVSKLFYDRIAALVRGDSGRKPEDHDLFIANSHWTAEVSAAHCRRNPVVLYPPVPLQGLFHAKEEVDSDFLCLGRIASEKQLEKVIEILECVRSRGKPVRLHIAGAGDDRGYVDFIGRMCEERRHWITVHGPLYGQEKRALLATCSFGISACDREAFGIATVEMIKSEIIPFVPSAGAQSEIVRNRLLIYESQEDAVEKICSVLDQPAQAKELRKEMIEQGKGFTPDEFCQGVRTIVAECLSNRIAGENVVQATGCE